MRISIATLSALALLNVGHAQRQMENLGRGVVAVPAEEGAHLVSWRLFGTDPESISFNVDRQEPDHPAVRINESPISGTTNYLVPADRIAVGAPYFVRPVVDGDEHKPSLPAAVWKAGFLEIPIQPIDGYRPGDASVADLDGDGDYEIVLQQGARTHDNSHSGLTGRPVVDAYEIDGTHLWRIDLGKNIDASPYSGMGGHSLSVADVDDDGRDEIVYQAMVIDDDGKGLHSSGLRHGDAMHISDLDPERAGLEIFTIQENEGSKFDRRTPGAAMRDAESGEILWSHSPGVDVAAGLAADVDPRHPGCEVWGGPGGLRTANGERIGPAPRTMGFAIWWDGDLLRELLSSSRVTKWDCQRPSRFQLDHSLSRHAGPATTRYPVSPSELEVPPTIV